MVKNPNRRRTCWLLVCLAEDLNSAPASGQGWGRELYSGPLDYKSRALTVRVRCLQNLKVSSA